MNLKKIDNPFGGLTYYKESTTSTMQEAKELMKSESIDGSLIVADYQTHGVGRVPGRTWFSKAGENVTFTLVLSMDYIGKGYTTIPLKTGLALSKTISQLSGKKTEVKWPNDVVVDGKKISGILCQSKGQSILIGVGINTNQLEFEDSIKDKATSLALLTNNGYSQEMVLSLFLENLKSVIESKDIWLDELNAILYNVGEEVSFAVGNANSGNIVNGILTGLNSTGKVVIKNSHGEISSYISGEFI